MATNYIVVIRFFLRLTSSQSSSSQVHSILYEDAKRREHARREARVAQRCCLWRVKAIWLLRPPSLLWWNLLDLMTRRTLSISFIETGLLGIPFPYLPMQYIERLAQKAPAKEAEEVHWVFCFWIFVEVFCKGLLLGCTPRIPNHQPKPTINH